MINCHRPSILAILSVALLGCNPGKEDTGDVTSATTQGPTETLPSEPTVTVATGFEYAAEDPWTELTAQPAEEDKRDAPRLSPTPNPQVGVVYLGDRLRIYNIGGRWRPATLTLLGEREQTLETFRLDLPASGVVRADLPQLTDNKVVRLRLTEPFGRADENRAGLELLDRRVGTPAAEFTVESVAELGFANIEEHTSDGDGVEDPLVGGYARGEVDAHALQSVAEPGDAARVTAKRTESGVTSLTFGNPKEIWESVVIAERHYSTAGHSGGGGGPPPESWWVSTVEDAFEDLAE